MHEQDPDNQVASSAAQEDILEIPDYIESLNGQAMQYVQTVRKDLEQLHPESIDQIEAFARAQIRSNLVLKDGLSSQQSFYNTHNKVQEKYNERLQEIYQASINFDKEKSLEAYEPRLKGDVINYQESMGKDFEKDITAATSFSDLFNTLELHKYVIGTDRIYTTQELIELINNYRRSGKDTELNYITRTGGLRDKVASLNRLNELSQLLPSNKKTLPATSIPRAELQVDSSPATKPAKGLRKFFGGFFKLFS